MNHFEQTFFELVRSAIWNTTPKLKHIPTESEWKNIYRISNEQTVTGIMLDAISKLPETHRPHKQLLMQWIVAQKIIERNNILMNKEVTTIFDELNKENISTYLMKGQGIAQLYPKPEHRICGDIDLYFKECDFEDAKNFFTVNGCNIEDEPNASHAETHYKGIVIELHRRSATFFTKRLQKKYNKITNEAIIRHKETVKIDEKEITVLPPMTNALQLLSHMLRHILMSGLGLRQVCDWVLFVYKYQSKIDKDLFIAHIKELQLFTIYKAMTAIAMSHLGLPKEYAVCEITAKDRLIAEKIMAHIMQYGNFGHYKENNSPKTKWEYFKSYISIVRNSFHFTSLSRSEAWNYPIWQMRSIKKILKR